MSDAIQVINSQSDEDSSIDLAASSSSEITYQPYHPCLPSIQEAQQNYNHFYSDHVPIIATIPFADHEVRVASWNVMEGDAYNGCAPLGQSTYGETADQRNQRYIRIAESIIKIIQQQGPDFINLQEISANIDWDDGLWKVINTHLQETDYQAVTFNGSVVDRAGNITLYNHKRYEPVFNGIQLEKEFGYSNLGAQAIKFMAVGNESLTIRLCNVHADYNDYPANHEQNIESFLTQGGENELSIVAGDFNCMIAPVENQPMNITTSAVPNVFREEQMQGACAIDGVFFKAGNDAIQQASFDHIASWDGCLVKEMTSLPTPSINSMPEPQQREIARFRMAIGLGANLKDQFKVVGNQFQLSEYQDYLERRLADTSVQVRPAVNLLNERALGLVILNSATKEVLHNAGFPVNTGLNQMGGRTYGITYVDMNCPPFAEEYQLQQQFMQNHQIRYTSQCSIWFLGFFKKTAVHPKMTLSEILSHAQSANNRSRQICVSLGWLNRDGSLGTNAPKTIKDLLDTGSPSEETRAQHASSMS